MQPSTIIKILTDVTALLPGAAPIHDILSAHPEQAAALIPVLQNLGEAPSAMAAAQKAAPDLAAAITKLAVTINVRAAPTQIPDTAAVHKTAENITRSLGGLGHMTPDQERQFLSQDSRSGSG
jgi:hypothetical protein